MFPELGDGGGEVGEVGEVGGQPEGFVLAVGVLDAAVGVPRLIAPGPGQLWLETLEQIVQAPCQDDDVVDVEQGHNHNGGVTNTSEDGAELLPAGDAALGGELPQGDLQEEDWQTSAKQENEVGDKKCTSAVLVAEVRETPDVPQTHESSGNRENKVQLAGPLLPLWVFALGLVFGPRARALPGRRF